MLLDKLMHLRAKSDHCSWMWGSCDQMLTTMVYLLMLQTMRWGALFKHITRLSPVLFCVIDLASHCAEGEPHTHAHTHTEDTIIVHCSVSLWTPGSIGSTEQCSEDIGGHEETGENTFVCSAALIGTWKRETHTAQHIYTRNVKS